MCIISCVVRGELCSRKESFAHQDAVGVCIISLLVRGGTMFEEEKSLFEKASADHDAVGVFIISRLVRGEPCPRKKLCSSEKSL